MALRDIFAAITTFKPKPHSIGDQRASGLPEAFSTFFAESGAGNNVANMFAHGHHIISTRPLTSFTPHNEAGNCPSLRGFCVRSSGCATTSSESGCSQVVPGLQIGPQRCAIGTSTEPWFLRAVQRRAGLLWLAFSGIHSLIQLALGLQLVISISCQLISTKPAAQSVLIDSGSTHLLSTFHQCNQLVVVGYHRHKVLDVLYILLFGLGVLSRSSASIPLLARVWALTFERCSHQGRWSVAVDVHLLVKTEIRMAVRP